MRRRRRVKRDGQLVLYTALVTLALTLLWQACYAWGTNGAWQWDTLDWVYVPGYEIGEFVRTVERINNQNPRQLVVRAVLLSGPPEVRGRRQVRSVSDLHALTAVAGGQTQIMRFLVEGPLSYYAFAEFSRLGPIQDITRRYLFSQVSVLKR